ncbi:hypothetical protein CDSE_0428 [Candidatus Kinetoplastibacterium desouzaii TCC079E]|uniref:Probable Fe(2+)-trafficking protein n=1 Tax=Candidatus Kinetoplastidibacterium desouzai TCC079E TaxID=1208919 RepID=M1M3D9_9PROT|nr:oxidative damage protection protein [Candidatus Kinetoplastibacterium desouzaii]AGF46750.1 hypothetical protein CDSE_0428 [Candidatus Kinetoplastibacterium desouzaii TCC079E]
MSKHIVNCIKLKCETEGLEKPPFPGMLGKRIWDNISKTAWEEWQSIQTRLINENRLNLADVKSRNFLRKKMESFLFEDEKIEADGYNPTI